VLQVLQEQTVPQVLLAPKEFKVLQDQPVPQALLVLLAPLVLKEFKVLLVYYQVAQRQEIRPIGMVRNGW
jgi:hypothetical protein